MCPSFLFLSTSGVTQGSLAPMATQHLPSATTRCADTQTGRRGSRLGRARYWMTGAGGAHSCPPRHSLSLTEVSRLELGFTGWPPLLNTSPFFPGRSTLARPFSPPGSPGPCLLGTNLHSSMNSTSWLMEAQYGWKFLRTPYQRSWREACVSSGPP